MAAAVSTSAAMGLYKHDAMTHVNRPALFRRTSPSVA